MGLKGGVIVLGSLTLCNLGRPYNLAGWINLSSRINFTTDVTI